MSLTEELVRALLPFSEPNVDLSDLICHRRLVDVRDCGRCRKVQAARDAIARARKEASGD